MKVLVTVKRVTDTEQRVRLAPDGRGIDLEGINFVTNPFDEIAVEEALRLQEQQGAEVVVVSVGTRESARILRNALAMGADRGILVLAEDLDGDAVARALAAVVEGEVPDLVLMGKQAPDDDANQVGQLLATYIDRPLATFVVKEAGLDSAEERSRQPGLLVEGGTVTAARQVDGGLEVVTAELPAVLTVDLRLNKPRLATLPGILKAKKKEIQEIPLQELGLDPTAKVRVIGYRQPAAKKAGTMAEGVEELVAVVERLRGPAGPGEEVGTEAGLSADGDGGVVLVVAEGAGRATRSAVRGGHEVAARIGGAVHLVVCGDGATTAALQRLPVAAVHRIEGPAEGDAATIAAVARELGAQVVVGAATVAGKDLLPRVAALLEAGMVSEVIGLGEGLTYQTPRWAGNVVATAAIETPVQVLSIRPTAFPPVPFVDSASPAPCHDHAVPRRPPRTRRVAFHATRGDRVDLAEARVVVAGGRGCRGRFDQVEQLADLLGGAVGATRVAVDEGWVSNDLQVGQTGKVVAPELYLALGISGAIQHVAGMQGAKTVIAVNKDRDAPIFSVANYGLVGEVGEVLGKLIERLGKQEGGD